MAQERRTQQSRNKVRSLTNMSSDSDEMDTDNDQTTARTQKARGGRRQLAQKRDQQGQQGQGGVNDIIAAVTPAFQEARDYIEGSPVRAAAIGAIAGGLLMTLFSTEKGRSFVKLAYGYASPMVTKYAREYISNAAGNMADSALAQH